MKINLAHLRHSIDQSALAYKENGKIRFYEDKHLVDLLSKTVVPRWTHSIDV